PQGLPSTSRARRTSSKSTSSREDQARSGRRCRAHGCAHFPPTFNCCAHAPLARRGPRRADRLRLLPPSPHVARDETRALGPAHGSGAALGGETRTSAAAEYL